ncbi:hypothetical protein BH11PLA2_BH11PLA2_11730 [soil metagenome]
MTTIRTALAALVLSLTLPALASAGHYSNYTYSTSRGYGYRTYTYYSQTHRTHHSHVAVYHPKHPRKVYYYNVQTKKYWGRYDMDTGLYSVLADADKKSTIGEIPDSAFPAGGKMPAEESGNEALLPPPETKLDNLPEASAAPVAPPTLKELPRQTAMCSTPVHSCHKN